MGSSNVALTILQGTNIALQMAPVALELALKIKALFQRDATKTYEVRITDLAGEAIQADDDTMALVNEWLVANGFEPLTVV